MQNSLVDDLYQFFYTPVLLHIDYTVAFLFILSIGMLIFLFGQGSNFHLMYLYICTFIWQDR